MVTAGVAGDKLQHICEMCVAEIGLLPWSCGVFMRIAFVHDDAQTVALFYLQVPFARHLLSMPLLFPSTKLNLPSLNRVQLPTLTPVSPFSSQG